MARSGKSLVLKFPLAYLVCPQVILLNPTWQGRLALEIALCSGRDGCL